MTRSVILAERYYLVKVFICGENSCNETLQPIDAKHGDLNNRLAPTSTKK